MNLRYIVKFAAVAMIYPESIEVMVQAFHDVVKVKSVVKAFTFFTMS